MTTKQFIEKAIKGGYKADKNFLLNLPEFALCQIWLDPDAWRAVGKVEKGWNFERQSSKFPDRRPFWQIQMLEMIDALAEGKSIEEFLKTL